MTHEQQVAKFKRATRTMKIQYESEWKRLFRVFRKGIMVGMAVKNKEPQLKRLKRIREIINE